MFPNFEFQSSEPHCSLKTKKYYYSFKTTWRFYVGVLTFSIFFKLSSSRSLDQEVAESLEEWAGSHVRAEVNFQIKDWGSGTGAHPVTGFILSGIPQPKKKFSNFSEVAEFIGDLKSKKLESGLFEDRISNVLALKWSGYSYSLSHLKTGPFEIQTFWPKLKLFLTKW